MNISAATVEVLYMGKSDWLMMSRGLCGGVRSIPYVLTHGKSLVN